MKMRLLTLGLFGFLLATLVGCNTVAGFGKDMQEGGQQLQKAVKDS